LNERIDVVLSRRLEQAIGTWCEEFSKADEAQDGDQETTSAEEASKVSYFASG
jgi:hypothetical protein